MRLCAVGLLAAGWLAGQDPDVPTFRSDTRLVIRAVKVRDGQGRAVEGLAAGDFTVTENGAPQRIAVCEFQRTADADDATAIAAVEQPTAARPARRLLVLYFDLDGIGRRSLGRAFAAAGNFVERRVSSSDAVAVMANMRGNLRMIQDFTSDRGLLLTALGNLAKPDEELVDPESNFTFGANNGEFNVFATDRRLAALERAARLLEKTRERKALIYFAAGWGLQEGRNLAEMRALVNAARRANVEIYPIDTRGLVAEPLLGDASVASAGGVEVYSGAAVAARTEFFEQSQDALYSLAADTGGKAWLNNNDLQAGIEQARRLYSSYYLIGYYSTHTEADGKFRRIAIRLPGREHLKLEYGDGYFGEKVFERMTAADRERHLEDAFALESPITEIPLAAAINYFQLNPDEYYVPVVVNIAGAELMTGRKPGDGRAELDLIGEIKDSNGSTVKTLRDRVTVKLDAARRQKLASGLVEYDTGYTLLPGEYALKLLVRDGETGRIGTLIRRFVIPNLNQMGPMRWSSLVLGGTRVRMGEAIYSAGRDKRQATNPLVAGGRKLVPSVTRVFDGDSSMVIYVEVYRPESSAPGPVTAYVGLYRGGTKVFETSPTEFRAPEGTRLKTARIELEAPLAALGAGRYDCQVSLIDRRSGRTLFWRAPVWVAR
ncbi:VWA domain-containing protein [uncultured Paludibaculum sp.]|uniref:VWA domain-containing protein n=1 Tax=uncultured Paludibaculum sp. TaxID=1765020 RepID=UPI002AAB810E|nr:VWA domain-containing protein [uncultured Paludibaculum sp.]